MVTKKNIARSKNDHALIGLLLIFNNEIVIPNSELTEAN